MQNLNNTDHYFEYLYGCNDTGKFSFKKFTSLSDNTIWRPFV